MHLVEDIAVFYSECFGEALRTTQDHLDSKNFYAFNPEFDKRRRRR